MDKNKMIGVDLTKNISQLNITTMTGALLSKKKLSRDRFKEFMKAHEPAIVVLETCGSAHYRAETLSDMGHDVKLIAPQYVKPFINRQKNDAAYAEGSCEESLAVEQTSGRQRMNIHGAIDLETGQMQILEVETVDAQSTIQLLASIEGMYPTMARIHLFLDNARYHHAKIVQDWMKAADRRIVLHFIPAYCPHLNPIERLWRVMHENITHNRCYVKFNEFCKITLSFLRERIPKNCNLFRDSVTDNFRVISPKDSRVMT